MLLLATYCKFLFLLQNKCVRYWPEPSEGSKEFETNDGMITVKHKKETNTSDYILREFEVSRTGQVSDYLFHMKCQYV